MSALMLLFWVRTALAGDLEALPLSSEAWSAVYAVPNKQGSAQFGTNGLTLRIIEDGRTLVHVLKTNRMAKGIRLSGSLRGRMNKNVPLEKSGRPADFYLRVGTIESGKRRLRWYEKLIAPDWIVRMEQLVPKSEGLGSIEFCSLGHDESLNGRSWRAKYGIREQQVRAVRDGDKFSVTIEYPTPRNVLAIWLFADGDDSRSTFDVTVNRLELIHAE